MGSQLYWPWQQQNSDVVYWTVIFRVNVLLFIFLTPHTRHLSDVSLCFIFETTDKLQCNILIIRTGLMRCYIYMYVCVWLLCGRSHWEMWLANRGIASTRFAVYECSSVKRPVIWHKVSEKPWPSDKLSKDCHTQMLAHTRIKEGEGQSPRSMNEREEKRQTSMNDRNSSFLCGWLDTVID